MNVLGIESSCDETAASVVKDGKKILSNVISSSLKFHQKYGGVIPEIASRKHLESITAVVESALSEAKLKLKDIGLISVTCGPGLLGSLEVGISFAKSLSMALDKPIIGVNHLESHIFAGFLEGVTVKFPFTALLVSGGHTSLYEVDDYDKIKLLGSTHDDACGEAFDKVAKILGLGYPGGPVIEQAAVKGDPKAIKFRCSNTKGIFDFSFSGIKTAVLYYVRDTGCVTRCPLPVTRDIAASFQESVCNVLVEKSLAACKLKKTKRLVVGGGVAANNYLRKKFQASVVKSRIEVIFPSKSLCMDNAAMVAGFGYHLFRKGKRSGLDLGVNLD